MRSKISDVLAILAFALMIPLNLVVFVSWIIFGTILYTSDHIIWKEKTKFITYKNFMLSII